MCLAVNMCAVRKYACCLDLDVQRVRDPRREIVQLTTIFFPQAALFFFAVFFADSLLGHGGGIRLILMLKVIRGLATGRFTPHAACALRVIGDQAIVGFLLGTALAAGGFVRVWVTEGTTLR